VSHRLCSLGLAWLLGSANVARADVVTDWNLIAVKSANTLGSASNTAPRVLAITHIAIYDALAAIEGTHAPYPTDHELTVVEPVSPEAAALKAAHAVLSTLVPGQRQPLTEKLTAALASIPGGAAKSHGIALGEAAAAAILELRQADGANDLQPAYTGSTEVGKWRPTGVDGASNPVPGADPHWKDVVPFAIESPDAFRAPAPPAVNSALYLTELAEVRTLGVKAATETTALTRSANQTEIAKFWEFGSHIPFNAIARQVARREGLSLFESARLFAHLNIALSDARVALWDSKYAHGTWRPITAIATGDGSEDDGSTSDAAWAPFLNTPAHPEYPSGHSGAGAAAAAVLTAWFGEEAEFTLSSDSLPEVTRSFTSFTQAALENGRSRIYGGIHFQSANAAGQALGKKVGEHVVANLFLALPPEPVSDAGAGDAGADDAGSDAAVADAGESDAAVGEDAGSAPDASTPVADAGGAAADAGGPVESGDSACSLSHAGRSHSSLLVVLGLALAVVGHRRRHRALGR
jgi:membrane-associated phospholipid phosphatase